MFRIAPMMLAGSLALLTAGAALAADKVPELNVDKACHAAAETGVRTAMSSQDDANACSRDESNARGKLDQEWSQFTPPEKDQCVRLSSLGGSPSYVELLTCLELAKQSKALPADVLDIGKGNGAAKP
jgi:hypothetical protein